MLFPLELELTESVLMHEPQRMATLIEKLSELGFKIAIDDFGTGYSSLNYLAHLKADTLKIDRVFVNEIENGTKNNEVVKAIVHLGHSLNMQILAEGVETEKQERFLKEVGCDLIQGYYFAKPLIKEDFIAFFAENLKKVWA